MSSMHRLRQHRSSDADPPRRPSLSTRLTLSELPDYESDLLPPPRDMDLPFNTGSNRSFSRLSRFESFTRARGELLNHVPPPPPLVPNNLTNNINAGDGEADVFHDCMDLEENSTFSNMFDDLDLEGSEMIQEEQEAAAAVQPDPIYDPVASTGNTSRGFSCKRKSAFHHHEVMPGNSTGSDFPRRPLVLPPPTLGASSSRSMDGPRPQKTRLSSEFPDSALGDSVFPSPRREYTPEGVEPSQVYPRAVRRAFPEGYRGRRVSLMDYPELPTSGGYDGSSSSREVNPSAPNARAPRFAGSGGVGGQGISRRIGRITSSRSLSGNPSPSEPSMESRTRSMRMAFLENGAFSGQGSNIRREVGVPGTRIHHPGIDREPRQAGRSSLFTCPPTPPQIALMESPELRSPPAFDGSLASLRRRELSEGFMAIPSSHEFDWEHHRPRFMAGGLAEILRALERVERDEDLTREQLVMLEATTFLFGGIGLHDDHSDWRLDIDNMSYEELLALGDRIGTVPTGLTEESISQKLKKTTYSAAPTRSSTDDSDVKCCICQEEFEAEVELGAISCGHKYHTNCIRQWLLRKNSCPVCKATGLPA